MSEYDFWKKWQNKSKSEEKAITSIKKARDLIIRSIPNSELVAIYIKGSFTRREMKESSDVDMVPIVTENKYEKDVFEVNCKEIEPVIVVPLSLWELSHNKLFSKGDFTPDLRAEPDLFLKKLNNHKIIYGTPINPEKFPIRTEREILKSEINKIRNGYIRAYEEGVIDFLPLYKEVFWLVELEQNIKGKSPVHSFKGILNSIDDKNHIIFDAFEFRKHRSQSIQKKKFISKLKLYLADLEELI